MSHFASLYHATLNMCESVGLIPMIDSYLFYVFRYVLILCTLWRRVGGKARIGVRTNLARTSRPSFYFSHFIF